MSVNVLIPTYKGKNGFYYKVEPLMLDNYLNKRPTIDGQILDSEIHEWLIENKIKYSLGSKMGPVDSYFQYRYNMFIKFRSKKDAMLFKLTWF
jgi:hypothetical protein